MDQIVADVPSRLSLAPSQEDEKKESLISNVASDVVADIILSFPQCFDTDAGIVPPLRHNRFLTILSHSS
jgi:hypothetical protein